MKHCEISIHVRIEIYAPSINELFHSISIFIRMQILRRISEAMKEEEEEEEGNGCAREGREITRRKIFPRTKCF